MKMKLTFEDIPPDISEEERKINIENFYNTICRINNVKNFSHCEYDIKNKIVHIVINREGH